MALRLQLFLVAQEVGLSEWRRLFRKVVALHSLPEKRRAAGYLLAICRRWTSMRYRIPGDELVRNGGVVVVVERC